MPPPARRRNKKFRYEQSGFVRQILRAIKAIKIMQKREGNFLFPSFYVRTSRCLIFFLFRHISYLHLCFGRLRVVHFRLVCRDVKEGREKKRAE